MPRQRRIPTVSRVCHAPGIKCVWSLGYPSRLITFQRHTVILPSQERAVFKPMYIFPHSLNVPTRQPHAAIHHLMGIRLTHNLKKFVSPYTHFISITITATYPFRIALHQSPHLFPQPIKQTGDITTRGSQTFDPRPSRDAGRYANIPFPFS